MAKKSKKSDSPSSAPVFDVSKPGETAASPTARPIITTHKAILKQDPMMSPEEDKEKEPEKKAPLKPKREIKVEPPASSAAEDKTATAPPEEAEAPEPAKEDLSQQPQTSDEAAIDALASQTTAKREQQKTDEAAARKKAEIDQLITSKKYHLPIHDPVYGGSSSFTWFINSILIIMVLAAAAVLAHDAGYVDLGIDLPFDLIK